MNVLIDLMCLQTGVKEIRMSAYRPYVLIDRSKGDKNSYEYK